MREVTLDEILRARELRVERQQRLLREFGRPLVCLTMNIAGPVKIGDKIFAAYKEGVRLIGLQLEYSGIGVLHFEECLENTGFEGFFVVECDVDTLKPLMCEIEEADEASRIFDIDVTDVTGHKAERTDYGYEARKCLICGEAAAVCGPRRLHSVEELQHRTAELLEAHDRAAYAERISDLAVRSLLYEVAVTPKPGLVDRAGNGSHEDMDFFSFLDSASVLQKYFRRMVISGMEGSGTSPALKGEERMVRRLQLIGKQAEWEMRRVTGGVNTHKGAIFSMGMVCAAAGMCYADSGKGVEQIAEECKMLAKSIYDEFLTSCGARKGSRVHAEGGTAAVRGENDAASARSEFGTEKTSCKPDTEMTHGETAMAMLGAVGVRGEAAKGLPSVMNLGLPLLERLMAGGATKDAAGSAVLLRLMSQVEDTNMMARSGYEDGGEWRERVRAVSESSELPERSRLDELGRYFAAQNLSPGGCADLLALCWMFYFLKTEVFSA